MTEKQSSYFHTYLAYGLLLAVMLLFSLVRLRLLDFPLERDEGEYAYAAQLMLHSGISQYKLCHTMKLPGTAMAYALIMSLFGQTTIGIHLGLWLVNLMTIGLMFALGKKLFGPIPGAVAAASYALLSAEPEMLALSAHATHFVVLFAVAGILSLMRAMERKHAYWLFAGGMLFAAAFLMKQPGIFFTFFALFMLLQPLKLRLRQWKTTVTDLAIFLAGFMAPLLLVGMVFYLSGGLQQLWFWSFEYAGLYGTTIGFSEGLYNFQYYGGHDLLCASLILLYALVGACAVMFDASLRRHAVFVLALLVFSFAAVSAGLYFRPHYFVMLFPALSLLCASAVALRPFKSSLWHYLPEAVFAFIFVILVVGQKELFFEMNPLALSRLIYSTNPFMEAPVIADYIRTHSQADDTLAVLGSEPEILFFAHRRSATGYIYMYPLMEDHPFASSMQKDMITEIANARPRFIVFVNVSKSWLMQPGSDRTILNWSKRYVHANYSLAGTVHISPSHTQYYWDTPDKDVDTASVMIFERK